MNAVRSACLLILTEKSDLRINRRGFDRPDARYDTIGLRVVMTDDSIICGFEDSWEPILTKHSLIS